MPSNCSGAVAIDESRRGWEFEYLNHARDDAVEKHQVARPGSPTQTVVVSSDEKFFFVNHGVLRLLAIRGPDAC